VEIGYYAQVQESTLDDKLSVYETIDHIATGEWRSISKIRGLLGAFLFSEDAIDKKVKVLSGGEKSRLALAKLLLNPVNLLILDEPTNHLDMSAKEVLKKALLNYDGTMILVSHDRDFLQGLTNRTFEFRENGIKDRLGDINVFLSAHQTDSFRAFESGGNGKVIPAHKATSENKKQYEQKKVEDKADRKLKNSLSKCEHEITTLESQIADLETKMADKEFYSNAESMQKAMIDHDEKKRRLARQMREWERISGEIEK